MRSTKKSFMKASGIISIIWAAIFILLAGVCYMTSGMFNAEFITEILAESGITYTPAEIELMVEVIETMFTMAAVYFLGFGIADLVLGIKVLKNASKGDNTNGANIGLLVVSVFSFNFLTVGFIITAICQSKAKTDNPSQNQLENQQDVQTEVVE